ncbi:MAG: hypothetical protein USCAAHI_01719 [Beijerinckiaceae bacterium]|nr:MAG: hypothetical protein USCAAHI_01719 [Beijerinckiaceae bacterium]
MRCLLIAGRTVFRIEALEKPGGTGHPQDGQALPVHQHVLYDYIGRHGKASWRDNLFAEQQWSPAKREGNA